MATQNILRSFLSKTFTNIKCARSFPSNVQPVRCMGHGRTMVVRSSKYDWRQFKDHVHFYVSLGLVPIAGVIFYADMFVGQAELADIPEGYEPEEYEYMKHPIKRWFVRYAYESNIGGYERNLHNYKEEMDLIAYRKLAKKVNQLMNEREDYKAWYYREILTQPIAKGRELSRDNGEFYN